MTQSNALDTGFSSIADVVEILTEEGPLVMVREDCDSTALIVPFS